MSEQQPSRYTEAEESEAGRLAIASGLGVGEWPAFLSATRANLSQPTPKAEVVGRCDFKQYEHCGPHERIPDVGQRLPPFGCKNWSPKAEVSERSDEVTGVAFETEDRGYTARASYLKEPHDEALIEIFKDGAIVRSFHFPAYKVWNIAAHFSDLVDSEIEQSKSANQAEVSVSPEATARPNEGERRFGAMIVALLQKHFDEAREIALITWVQSDAEGPFVDTCSNADKATLEANKAKIEKLEAALREVEAAFFRHAESGKSNIGRGIMEAVDSEQHPWIPGSEAWEVIRMIRAALVESPEDGR